MAETSVLRSSASPRPMSPQAQSASAHVQTSGPLPPVIVSMNNGRPQIGNTQPRSNVTVFPPRGRLGSAPIQQRALPVAAVAAAPAPASVLSLDQLMLCRHLVGEYAKAQAEAGDAGNAELAENTIVALDQELAVVQAIAARQEALDRQQAAIAARLVEAAPAPVPPRQVAVGTRSTQLSAGLAPRRIPRPGLPPVQVRMNGKDPVLESGEPSEE